MKFKMKYKDRPLYSNTLDFFLGFNCNLRCEYCNLDKDKTSYKHGLGDLKRVLDMYKHHPIDNITISGGEPTLFKNEVLDILKEYSEKFFITLITNGTNYDILQEFLEYRVGIILSYDGHSNERGYDSWETLCKLYDDDQLYQISMVVENKNYDSLYDTLVEMETRCPGLVTDHNRTKLNIARATPDYYNFDLQIFEDQIRKVYKRFPNLWNFKENERMCKNYFKWTDAHVCSHYTGDTYGDGCYNKYSNYKDVANVYYNKCYNCNNVYCWGYQCPNVVRALDLNLTQSHPYCSLNSVVTNVVDYERSLSMFNTMIENSETIELSLTENCNLRCGYCYEDKKDDKCVMTKDVIDKLFNDIIPKVKSNVIDFDILGGEPILPSTKEIRKHLLEKIKSCPTKKFNCMMSTNGFDYSDFDYEWIIDILNNENSDIILQFSIDGIKEVHDKNRPSLNGASSFDQVISTLKTLVDVYHFPINKIRILTVLDTQRNKSMELLPEWVQFVTDNLIDKYTSVIKFRPVQNRMTKFTNEDFVELKTSIEKVYKLYTENLIDVRVAKSFLESGSVDSNMDISHKNCGMCKYLWVLCPNGDIIPCHYLLTDELRYKSTLGNIVSGYINSSAHKIIQEYSQANDVSVNINGETCENCTAFHECHMCRGAQLNGNNKNKTLQYTCDFAVNSYNIKNNLFGDRFTRFSHDDMADFMADFVKLNKMCELEINENEKNKLTHILEQMSLIYLERRRSVDICCD